MVETCGDFTCFMKGPVALAPDPNSLELHAHARMNRYPNSWVPKPETTLISPIFTQSSLQGHKDLGKHSCFDGSLM